MMRPETDLPEDELVALLHLRLLPGLSDRRLAELIATHGSAQAVLRLPASRLGEEAASARDWMPVRERLRRAREVIDTLELRPLVAGRARYPERLLHLHDPPCFLFARGRLELLERPALAIVGARRHTPYGAESAAMLARGLAAAGVVVVSGLARGIDAAAHEAALAGGTIAVLGCGIDVAYPRQNAALQERIGTEGLLLSEFSLGAPPIRDHFPRRNRIIAALALGVVVVEASSRSGSLSTARHAGDLGREVFAVPGPIGRETSEGTNDLLKDGASWARSAAEILETLQLPSGGTPTAPDAPDPAPESDPDGIPVAGGSPLLKRLSLEPLHLDELASAVGMESADAAAELLELELAGHARQLPGMRFVRG